MRRPWPALLVAVVLGACGSDDPVTVEPPATTARPEVPDGEPAVWAIDEVHSPLYWFPRDTGQWISDEAVVPLAVEPVGDLLDRHAAARIELRGVPDLWPLRDLAVSDRWEFSLVRMANATPRP